MALKDNWTNKVDGQDICSADDVNQIAQAVIDLENGREQAGGGTPVWELVVSRDLEDGTDCFVFSEDENETPFDFKAVAVFVGARPILDWQYIYDEESGEEYETLVASFYSPRVSIGDSGGNSVSAGGEYANWTEYCEEGELTATPLCSFSTRNESGCLRRLDYGVVSKQEVYDDETGEYAVNYSACTEKTKTLRSASLGNITNITVARMDDMEWPVPIQIYAIRG